MTISRFRRLFGFIAGCSRLEDGHFFRAVNHALAILGAGGKDAVPILLRSLRRFGENLPESSERFRFALANLAWVATGPEVAPALLELMLFTRALAAKTLGRTGKTRLPAILQACRSDTLIVRRGGAQALANFCQRLEAGESEEPQRRLVEQIHPVLLDLLRFDDRAVVLMALDAVTALGAEAEGLLADVSRLENAEDRRIAERAKKAKQTILERKTKSRK